METSTLKRNLGSWHACDSAAVANATPAAVTATLADARHDILALAQALTAAVNGRDVLARLMEYTEKFAGANGEADDGDCREALRAAARWERELALSARTLTSGAAVPA